MEKYEEIISKLEVMIANDLDNKQDSGLIKEINSLVEKTENGYFDMN